MAEPVQNFRTAFHGFNREDVVRFLETATARHTAEVNQLQDDVARLEKELAALREQQTPEVSREELEALRGENTRLKAQIEELEAQLTEPEAPVGDQTNWKDEELAAYRRAETVERQARNRAAQMYHRVNGLIARLSGPDGGQQGRDDHGGGSPGSGPGSAAVRSGWGTGRPHRGRRNPAGPGAGAPGRGRDKIKRQSCQPPVYASSAVPCGRIYI